jgi:hypothetical protein
MFCGLRLSRISPSRVTADETGNDEPFFLVSSVAPNATLFRIPFRPIDPYDWSGDLDLGPNESARDIIIWEGFIPENETASIQVDIVESDSARQAIGAFTVEVNARSPDPVIQWFPRGLTTTITGPTQGEATTISASGSGALYQVDAVIDKARTITNVNSGKCLDVENGSMNDNANVQQFMCLGQTNQKWYIRNNLLHSAKGRPFDSTPLRWFDFILFADHSGKCLDIEAAGSSTNVQQYRFWPGPFSIQRGEAPNQWWYLVPAPGGDSYYIINNRDWHHRRDEESINLALDVENASPEDNANVQVYPFHGGTNQMWRISPPPLRHSRSPYNTEFYSGFLAI